MSAEIDQIIEEFQLTEQPSLTMEAALAIAEALERDLLKEDGRLQSPPAVADVS